LLFEISENVGTREPQPNRVRLVLAKSVGVAQCITRGRRAPGTVATMTVIIPDTEDKVINAELSYAGLEVSDAREPRPSRAPFARVPKNGHD